MSERASVSRRHNDDDVWQEIKIHSYVKFISCMYLDMQNSTFMQLLKFHALELFLKALKI